MKKESFSREERIRKKKSYQAVYNNGKTLQRNGLKIFYCPNRISFSRLGITVPKSAGKAVIRNRYRRWIREVFRRNKDSISTGVDIVVCVFRDNWQKFHSFRESLFFLFRKANILK